MNLRTWSRHFWLLPAFCIILGILPNIVSSETRVVCYYTNWSVYRPGTAKFSPQNINPYLCTHLIYAFGGFTKENSLKPFDKYQDIEKGGYAKFTGLKTYNKNLKTMLAIGGWNEGSSRFSPMVASPDRRREMVKNAVKFLRQNHFDGLDLDWEYPSFRDGGKARDRDNYANLVQELREEFDRESEKTGRPRLLLTMAVPAGIEYINKGYDIPKLNKYLDWMNILSYDYHSAFEPAVNHHSPLYPMEEDDEYNYDGDLNIDHTIKHYLKAGADAKKLVLGIPTYGRSYTLFNPDANELGAPADGPGDMGDATRENGYLAYYEICENIKENNWKVVQPNPDAMGPYAFKENQWVSYDDELIVRKKSEYVVEKGLGGIMFWSIDNDDFRGNCFNKPYPLIEAAKEALLTAASGKTDDNLISSPAKSRRPASRTRTRLTSVGENSVTSSRVQNSGGRQSINEQPSSGSRKRIRPNTRTKARSEETQETRPRQKTTGRRRRPTTSAPTTIRSTTPSYLLTTPMYKTPEPPTTPDPGGDFKCEEDGFFPHPRDCKKYFWCLSGPADLGIIAHQFTCPAGLYFNKAADSCDYSQNVLCNKKLKTAATTTTSTTTTTTSTTETPTLSTTTRRVPLRVTAATSRTTFSTTSTTEEPEYYEEYEYEDDDDDLDDDLGSKRGSFDTEEDPRVIKELVDLIKKVGGVEELEKYLKVQEDGTMGVTSSGSTTPATISRSLYERVLSRANAKPNLSNQTRGTLSYSTVNRNSRPGPQNQGIEKQETEDGSRKGRPQYTTINRNRPSTEKTVEEEEQEIDDEIEEPLEKTTKSRQYLNRNQNQPEYVTIRRQRPSTTESEDEITSKTSIQSRIRGIPGEDIVDDVTEASQGPEYVTLRRQRPSTEEPATSKYTTILRKRPNTESPENNSEPSINEDTTTEKRFRSTTVTETTQTSVSTTVQDDTTIQSSTEKLIEEPKTTTEESASPSTTDSSIEAITDTPTDKTNQISDSSAISEKEKITPTLFRPRPFTTRTRSTTSTTETPVTKVGEITKPGAQNRNVLVRKFQPAYRFIVRGQGQTENTQSKLTEDQTEEYVTVTEETTNSELEYQKRVRNRGKSRFRLTTSTSEPFTRRRVVTNPNEYEYDDEDQPHRTYRPSILADLSSLTSADITFQRNNQRKHRRRPVTTSTISSTEATTEASLKTGPRTLPVARKLIAETTFGRANRRVRPKLEDDSKTEDVVETVVRPRPTYTSLFRTTTTNKPTEQIEISSNNATASVVIDNEVTETSVTENDSNESNSDNVDIVSLDPNIDVISTTLQSSTTEDTKTVVNDDLISEGTTLQARVISTTERILPTRRLRVTTLADSTARARKVFVANRRRSTTPSPTDDSISTSSINVPDIKRPRLSYLSLRNNQSSSRPNITRLRPIESEEVDTKKSSGTTRNYIKRIRPEAPRVDEDEKIKLSETNISENDYFGTARNLPEDDSGKVRRRKIIRRIRPGKDSLYAKDSEDEVRRIKNSDKNTTENDEIDGNTDNPEGIRQRETFRKSESTDILRSKLNQFNNEDDDEAEIDLEEKKPESVSTVRNRNIIRKFRPVQSDFGSRVVGTNTVGNRTRKIIRRLRPFSTTTENIVSTSETPITTISDIPIVENISEDSTAAISETTPDDIPEDISNDSPEPEIETETEYTMTTIEDVDTTILFTTEETTTVSTTPRPTRPSLIGRSRPAYRPRSRAPVEGRSTTPSNLPTFRRRFNPVQRPEIKDEPEDGIIDDKLKKFYNKKYIQRTTQRSKDEEEISTSTTTQRSKDDENKAEEISATTTEISKASEQEDAVSSTTELFDKISTETTESSDQIIEATHSTTDKTETTSSTSTTEAYTTVQNLISETSALLESDTTTSDNIPENLDNIVTDIPATEMDTIPEDMTTIIPSEFSSITTATESTTQSDTTLKTTEEISTSTTESNTDIPEIIIEEITSPIPTSSIVTESTTQELTSTTETNDQDRTYKPIRFKPGDRPKLRIKLNRTEASESDRTDTDDQKSRKFTPSRTLNQRNRSKLAYRKDTSADKSRNEDTERTFVPTGRKIDRPKLNQNDEVIEKEEKSVRSHYPTLKPTDLFNLNRHEPEIEDESSEEEPEVEEEIEKQPPVENPLIKYLQTIRTQQDNTPIEQDVTEEDNSEEDEPEVEEEIDQPPVENPLTKYLQTVRNQQEILPIEKDVSEEPDEIKEYDDVDDDVEDTPNSNIPKYNIPSSRPSESPKVQNIPTRIANRPQFTPNRPSNEPRRPETRRPINELIRTQNEPSRILETTNRPLPNRPTTTRNYPRKFNKPVYITTSTTTETLAGVDLEALNVRNKNLYNKNRKMNVPQVVTTTESVSSSTPETSSVETTTLQIPPITEETVTESTTELLSTLHHVFAEPDIPETSTLSMETTTTYNLTAAQLEAARSLERLIEVNRIVEVSFKEDKVKNSSGLVESRVMLEGVPTLDRIGAINRLTVIKVVDGGNETNATFPSNHAVTLNEIVTGRRFDQVPKIDIVAKLHAPDINLTKMNILNNTLEIIESLRISESTESSSEENTSSEQTSEQMMTTTTDLPQFLESVVSDTVPIREEPKFEIYSRSNVVDYSRRDLIQNLAQAQPITSSETKGRKLAIDSKSVVANNNNRPVFTESTTLPIEALFQTGSPELPTLREVVTGKGNLIDDDQDLLESQHGRIRIRILGQDLDYNTKYEREENPKFASVRVLTDEPTVTLKADVIEVTPSTNEDTIKIAPIDLSVAQRVPVIRIESSVSQSVHEPFNQAVIFGDN